MFLQPSDVRFQLFHFLAYSKIQKGTVLLDSLRRWLNDKKCFWNTPMFYNQQPIVFKKYYILLDLSSCRNAHTRMCS